MAIFTRTLIAFAHFGVISVLIMPLPSRAAETNKVTSGSSSQATGDIIALPLNPIIPARQRSCSEKTEAGLGYTILRPVSGDKPAEADVVLVNYIGYLAATGEVFDQAMRAGFPVREVIPGFSKGLQMLTRGGIARFCIPAALGYGAEASGPIPANSDLVFQVELVDYKTAAEIEEMRKASAVETGAQAGAVAPP